jgi:hypothetical protein
LAFGIFCGADHHNLQFLPLKWKKTIATEKPFRLEAIICFFLNELHFKADNDTVKNFKV